MLHILYLFWLLNNFYGHITPVCSQITDVFISDPYPTSTMAASPNSKGLAYITYNFTSGSETAAMCHKGTIYNWTDAEADVICRESGFEGGIELGRLPLTYINHLIITNMHCTGDERFLEDCLFDEPVLSEEGCGELGYVGVSCYNDKKLITFTDTKGVIESQNYPNPYPDKAAYTYIIQVPNALEIKLVFLTLRLERGYDFVYMGSGGVPTSLVKTDIFFTGLKQPNETTVTLSTDEIWIRFISDTTNPWILQNLHYSLTWEASVKHIPETTPRPPITSKLSPDDRDNSPNRPQNTTTNPVTMVSQDSNKPVANTQNNIDVVIGVSMGITLCFLIIIIVVVIILYKRRRSSKVDNTKTKQGGLAFNGPYDITVQNGASVFVGANQTNGIPIPHVNVVYEPEGHDDVSNAHHDQTNQNGDGYDYIGNQDVANNTSRAHLGNPAYNRNPESNLDDNVYHDINDEANAYNYIDTHTTGGVTHNEYNEEGIYEDTSGMHMDDRDNNEDSNNDGIYAV